MNNFAKIYLHPKKERSLKLFHPWLFSGAIARVEDNPGEGDYVEVYSKENEFLGLGHYHDGSIKVRIISFEKADPDENFWIQKFINAFRLRERLGLINNKHTNIYRLINGEADGLPGLIIDMYDTVAVVQTHTLGMHRIKDMLLIALNDLYPDKLEAVYDKSADTMGKGGTLNIKNDFLLGDIKEKTLLENDIQFNVNWVDGQKTGFFIDQRENRKLLEKYSRDKTVLNTFSYSGGFSMYALKGGATQVHSVDSSKKASELSEKNALLNEFSSRHSVVSMDVFDFLKKGEEKYDIIVLDPPAFAKHQSAIENAMVGYRNLNTEGIKKVKNGGLVFTFSCSQVIDKMLFRKLVFQAAVQAKRNVRIIHQLSQGPDHPISLYHPEGEYLKGLVLMVD